MQGTTSASSKLTPELTPTCCLLDASAVYTVSTFAQVNRPFTVLGFALNVLQILKPKEMGIHDVGFHQLTTKGIEALVSKIKNICFYKSFMVYPRKQGWEYYMGLNWDENLNFLVNKWLKKPKKLQSPLKE